MHLGIVNIILIFLSCCITGKIMFSFMFNLYAPIYTKKSIYIFCYMAFVCIDFILTRLETPIILSLYSISMLFVLSYLLFNISKKNPIVCNIAFVFYTIFIDIITIPLVSLFISKPLSYSLDNQYIMLLTNIIYNLIIICTYQWIISLISKRKIDSIVLQQNIFFIVLSFFEILIICYILNLISDSSYGLIMLILVVFFMGLDIYLISLFEKISRFNRIKQELLLEKQQSILLNKYYIDIKSKYEDSRKIIHDVKNHLQVLRGIDDIDNNIRNKYEIDIINKMDQISMAFKCTDQIINIILNYKISVFKKLGIIYRISMQDVNLGFMDSYDKTSLFTNILDNAIEACIEAKDNKYIEIRLHQFNDFIIINIINSFNSLNLNGAEFISTKPGHVGIGISNIKGVVEKYNGNIKFDYVNNNFFTKIILPISFDFKE